MSSPTGSLPTKFQVELQLCRRSSKTSQCTEEEQAVVTRILGTHESFERVGIFPDYRTTCKVVRCVAVLPTGSVEDLYRKVMDLGVFQVERQDYPHFQHVVVVCRCNRPGGPSDKVIRNGGRLLFGCLKLLV